MSFVCFVVRLFSAALRLCVKILPWHLRNPRISLKQFGVTPEAGRSQFEIREGVDEEPVRLDVALPEILPFPLASWRLGVRQFFLTLANERRWFASLKPQSPLRSNAYVPLTGRRARL